MTDNSKSSQASSLEATCYRDKLKATATSLWISVGEESVEQFGNLRKKGVISDIKIIDMFFSTQRLDH